MQANPEVAKDFTNCPFVASHIIRKTEMGEHLKVCTGRQLFEKDASRRIFIIYINFFILKVCQFFILNVFKRLR